MACNVKKCSTSFYVFHVFLKIAATAGHNEQRSCTASPPNSPISERVVDTRRTLLPLRPIHLASRCHEEVLYTRLNRSCSINSAASFPPANVTASTSTSSSTSSSSAAASAAEERNLQQKEMLTSGNMSEPDAVDQQPHPELTMEPSRTSLEPPESRIMVNLEAIELVSNLDNVSEQIMF